jgi:glycolate oxidase
MSDAISLDSIISALEAVVGKSLVLIDSETRTLYSQDVWTRGELPLCVVRPASVEQLQKIIKTITDAGIAVITRGGGMSYTKGYLPIHAQTIIVDTLSLDTIVEINRDDMYVTVEAGCTWQQLYEALKDSGLRTPYWGTLSGSKATIGGSISQNSIFWGCGQWGSAADSVVSLDVVLADGSLLSTGSAAQINGSPFFRHFGPDLTGLFTSDCGALGIKARITLRLTPELPARAFASFNFSSHEHLLDAMNTITRRGLSMECYGFDPNLTAQRARRDRLVNDVKAFAGVLKNSTSIFAAIKNGIKIAIAGRGFMNELQWPMHVSIEERCDAAADVALKEVREIVARNHGQELENSIPMILRANPFPGVNNMIGPGGERWVPVHGLLPLSQAKAVVDQMEIIYAQHREAIALHQITTGYLFAGISTNCMAVEPVFFWPDQLDEIQKHSVESAYYQKVTKHPPNFTARELVATIRQQIVDAFRDVGAVHLQIGKVYHYKTGLKAEPLELIEHIKRAVDPRGLMNPGALGL